MMQSRRDLIWPMGDREMAIEMDTMLARSPEVCGGRVRIDGTRVTVQQIAVWYRRGYTPKEIADQYSHLTLAQVFAALTYYHANQEEIEKELAAEQAEAEWLEQVGQEPAGLR